MRRERLIGLGFALVALVALVPGAHAGDIVIGAFGGAALPTGDFKDIDATTGWRFGGAADYALNNVWAVGVDGSLNGNEHKDVGVTEDDGQGGTYTLDEDKYTTWTFGAHARAMAPMSDSPVQPYGIVGVGFSSTKEKYTETFTFGTSSTTESGEEKSDTRFAARFGAGAVWSINEQWGLGGEVDFTTVSQDKDKTGISSISFVGLQGVLTFTIPGAS